MFKQQTLKLLSVKSLKNGELMLHYETVGQGMLEEEVLNVCWRV